MSTEPGQIELEHHFSGRSVVVREIYDALIGAARTFGRVEEDPKKTSIHLNRKTAFAGVQTRQNYLLLTVKSDLPIDSERVFKSEKTSANRWHAEIKLRDPAEVDHELIDWLENGYQYRLEMAAFDGRGEKMKLSILFAALFALGGLSNAVAFDPVRAANFPVVIPLPAATPERQTKPPYDSYRGVTIGMSAADVRAKLGKPKEESDAEDDFAFSDFESARVFYDENKTVRVISIMYTGDMKLAPAPKAIVGTDIEAKPDGGMHKMVQYPKAGFWISYVRTGGDEVIVLITIQKMAKES